MQVFLPRQRRCLRRVFPLLINIIRDELRLRSPKNKIYLQNRLMPIGVTVFRSREKLGSFDPHNYQIGKRTSCGNQRASPQNILRHEMAEYMTHLLYENTILPHGPEYRTFCQQYGWGEDIHASRADLTQSNAQIEGDLVTERLISKVQKLLELASSSNQHEADLATIKANQMIIQHNLDLLNNKKSQGQAEETTFLKRILFSKQNNPKCVLFMRRSLFSGCSVLSSWTRWCLS